MMHSFVPFLHQLMVEMTDFRRRGTIHSLKEYKAVWLSGICTDTSNIYSPGNQLFSLNILPAESAHVGLIHCSVLFVSFVWGSYLFKCARGTCSLQFIHSFENVRESFRETMSIPVTTVTPCTQVTLISTAI